MHAANVIATKGEEKNSQKRHCLTQGDPGTLQRSLFKLTLASNCTVKYINFQMWRSRVYAKNQLYVSRADVCVSRNDLLKLPQASTVI